MRSTIATQCSPSVFSKLLFPAFGAPIIASWIPERMISPRRPSSRCLLMVLRRLVAFALAETTASAVEQQA